MKHIYTFLIGVLLTACTNENKKNTDFRTDYVPSTNLEKDFLSPPDYAKPRVFWWWLEGNISQKGILSDLTAMKQAGIQGVIIFDAGSSSYKSVNQTTPGSVFMSPEWQELFVYTCQVADSLQMEVSLNIGSGWNDGGPWVTPEFASKKMVWSETSVSGGGQISIPLPLPEGLLVDERTGKPFYEPITVLAIKKNTSGADVKPLEHMNIKAVHSIRIPKTEQGIGFDWDILVKEEPSPEGDCHARLADVINISGQVDANGQLNWDVPEGEYTIMRFGYTGTGIQVSTHSPGGGGLAIDYMSTQAMDLQYGQTAGKLIRQLKEKQIHSLKYLHDDSWELGAANWTSQFEKLFQKANNYDILSYLPILTGKVIESRDVSNRFLYDFRRTLGDLIWENHYSHFRTLAHADGVGIHPESGGPHPAPIDALKNLGQNDIPMGEFWIRANTHRITPDARLFVKQPAAAAHIYGKRFVQAEGPTSIGPHWEEDFAYMKPTLDRVYCEGLNRLIIHTYTHTPEDAGIPGNEYFAGTHFNPNVTWWKQAPAFLAWNSRISFMLAQGLFVGDVCFYYGDNVPNQVPLKHIHKELGEGYDYDVCNTEVILNRMTAKNGKIYLPDGMSYEALVLPNRKGMTPEVLEKLESLVKDGATIIGPKPTTSVGLRHEKQANETIQHLADRLWGESDNEIPLKKSYGKGTVFAYTPIREALQTKGINPDFTYQSRKSDALIDYIHRTTDEAEIYYVVNRNERPEYIHASFRIDGKTPECWNPITGEAIEQTIYQTNEGITSLPLFLEPFGSVFVVFRKPESAHKETITWNGTNLFPNLPADTFQTAPFIQLKDHTLLFTSPGTYEWELTSGEKEKANIPDIPVIPITSTWQVSFDPNWGAPKQVSWERLVLWNTHADPGIRYYSGTASYTNRFNLPTSGMAGKKVMLDLGEMYNLAEVYVNGISAGVWWQPPFIGDITSLLKDGENKLEVKVVNLWPNRIIGDQSLPEEKRYTRTNVIKFDKDYPLRPSGLLGPVCLRIHDTK